MISITNTANGQAGLMHTHIDKILLAVMWVIDLGVWTHNFSIWIKLAYGIIAALATILGLINQWNTFKKTYKTTWIVVRVESILSRTKNRHHKNSIAKTKRSV